MSTNITELLKQSVTASRQLITLSDEAINRILTDTADELINRQAEVLTANEKDLARMDPAQIRPFETDHRSPSRYCRRHAERSLTPLAARQCDQ